MTISAELRCQRRLVVMLKEPRPGRVKTRLGKDIGMTEAAWWFRHQAAALLRRVTSPKWQTVLAVSPDNQALTRQFWPESLPRVPQGNGDLGDRMARLFRSLPPGPICIIGADIPGIDSSHVWRAFRQLGRHEAVFGPAMDGGYWLVGLKRVAAPPSGIFENVRWSTKHALSDSIETLRGNRIALVDRLRDVDTSADL